MDCRQAETLIGAYLDEELDLRSALEIEEHVKGCANCARALASHRALREALSQSRLSYPVPAALRRRILAATAAPARSRWPEWLAWRPMTLTASLAAIALLASSGALRWRSIHREDLLVDQAVAGHVRSLEASHLMDVPSTDKHTVKPWFAGKLDYSPPVENLAAEGFPLIGGRLDYMDGRPVSALVYHRGGHTINLFVWPASGEASPSARTDRGFHVVRWTRGGMTYWAVSDLNEKELSQFAEILRSRE